MSTSSGRDGPSPPTASLRLITVTLLVFIVGGCTAIPADSGREDVQTLLKQHGRHHSHEVPVSTLLAGPLTAEQAATVALVNNPSLRATYAELGFGAADLYEASRVRNPVFSATLLDPDKAGEGNQLTFGLIGSFTDVLTLSARQRLARAEFSALKLKVGAAVLETAADAEAAYYAFVGAKQVAALRQQTAKAAGLSAELAARYYDAGNLSPREMALQRAAATEANLNAIDAQGNAFEARTALARMLGVSVGTAWDVPAALSLPPADEPSLEALLALAADSRLDLAAAQTHVEIAADQLGITNWTRWLGELDIGAERERDSDGTKSVGPTVEWELPIFSQNRDRQLRRTAELEIQVAELAALRLGIDNQVRLAYASAKQAKHKVEQYRQHLIPARVQATARAQEEENFMLIGTFELIESKQQEYDTYQGYLEAIRDYWLAYTELSRAVGNSLPTGAPTEQLDIDTLLQQPQQENDHSGHGAMDHDEAPFEEPQHHHGHNDHGGHHE